MVTASELREIISRAGLRHTDIVSAGTETNPSRRLRDRASKALLCGRESTLRLRSLISSAGIACPGQLTHDELCKRAALSLFWNAAPPNALNQHQPPNGVAWGDTAKQALREAEAEADEALDRAADAAAEERAAARRAALVAEAEEAVLNRKLAVQAKSRGEEARMEPAAPRPKLQPTPRELEADIEAALREGEARRKEMVDEDDEAESEVNEGRSLVGVAALRPAAEGGTVASGAGPSKLKGWRSSAGIIAVALGLYAALALQAPGEAAPPPPPRAALLSAAPPASSEALLAPSAAEERTPEAASPPPLPPPRLSPPPRPYPPLPSPPPPAPPSPPPSPSPPSPSPPPPSPHSSRVAARLNERFRSAHFSSRLSEAGVLLRSLDHTEDQSRPWQGCVDPAAARARSRDNADCAELGGRLSAMFVSAAQSAGNRRIPIFSPNRAGVVYRPEAIERAQALACAYGNDGGTRGKADGCAASSGEVPDWCPRPGSKDEVWCDGRPHPIKNLDALLRFNAERGGYNECILGAANLAAALPQAVEALFYVAGAYASVVEARATYARFLDVYGEDADVALVQIDPNDWESPFSSAER